MRFIAQTASGRKLILDCPRPSRQVSYSIVWK